MALTDDLKKAQLWPIKAKGKVERFKPLGDQKIEHFYHESMEQGRLLEKSITDAMNWCQEKKRDLNEKIQMYFDINRLAIDGKLKRRPRAILYAVDSIRFINQVNSFMRDITGLIQAVTQNIGMLSAMEQNMLQMIQSNLNALANLIHEICNWGLPDIPAIPNLFSDTVWQWNGFNFFPLAGFKPHVGFDVNFAFNQCQIHLPNVNIFRNYPTTVQTYSGLSYGTPFFVPPLGGLIPDTGYNLSDPQFIEDMRNYTIGPYYDPDKWNADPEPMWGAIPNPANIISNYQMPANMYQDNIVSIVPNLRGNTIEPGDKDYDNPNYTTRNANLRKDLVHYVTLEQVVDSGYDKFLTSAWLYYLNSARSGRAGGWIQNFEVAYATYISPSLVQLTTESIPWNEVLPGDTLHAGPDSLGLVDTIQQLDAMNQGNLLWKLSYIEAALLGYTRSQRWDGYADANYVSNYTGTDLDYAATTIDKSVTSTVVLGEDTADYPVECTFPSAIGDVLQQVIAMATDKIARTPDFRSSRPQFRYIYNQFAEATEVDRYSQFWREFNSNLQGLLIQDPYLVQFTTSYAESLDSAIDPLGDSTIFESLRADAQTRNRNWVPGYPLLKVPKAPIVSYTNNSTPSNGQNGWQDINFDPTVFLSRPDIQAQPIPVQTAMLRTNLSYAGLMQFQQQMQDTVSNLIAQSNQLLQEIQNMGFNVEVNSTSTIIVDPAGQPVAFGSTVFDYSGYVTSATTFTVQNEGTFALSGQVNFAAGDAGTRTITIYQNGQAIYTQSSDPNAVAPVDVQFSTNGYFQKGDVVQVFASHNLSIGQDVNGGFFTMMLYSADAPVTTGLADNTNSTKTFTAGAALTYLSAVHLNGSGEAVAVDPVNIVTDGNGHTVYPFVDGITLSSAASGSQVDVATSYGGIFNIPNLGLTPGGLLYVGPGGALTQDFNTIATSCAWVICVGRAIDSENFLYEPQLPTRTVLTF